MRSYDHGTIRAAFWLCENFIMYALLDAFKSMLNTANIAAAD
jgi:hypothetical protein